MPTHKCPQCGRELPPGAADCPACRELPANPYASPAPPVTSEPDGSGWFVFGIMALVGAVLAVGIVVPGLGVALGMFITPGLVRASVALQRRREAGKRVAPGDSVTAIFASLGVTLAACVAATVAFVAVCLPFGAAGDPGVGIFGVLMGGIAGLTAWGLLFRKFWPKRPEEHRLRRPTSRAPRSVDGTTQPPPDNASA
jgi:hypothetical protein